MPSSLQGPYGVSIMPSGYEGATGGFYINKDKQPQATAAPILGGFYQRDARDVEAQLLAQAFAARMGQPAAGQPLDGSALPHESASGRAAAAGVGGASSIPGGVSHQSSRAQSPAVPSMGQHGAAGLNNAAHVPMQAGTWAAGRPVPSVPSPTGTLLGHPSQLQGSLLGSGLPQLPQPALWPTQPNQLAQQPGGYSLFPGSLGTSMAVSSGMPGLGMTNVGAAGQGLQGFPGYLGQYGASNAGRFPICSLRQIHLICSLSTSVNQAVFQAAAPLQNAYLWRLSSVLALQGVHMAFRMAQYTWAAGSPLPSRALLA